MYDKKLRKKGKMDDTLKTKKTIMNSSIDPARVTCKKLKHSSFFNGGHIPRKIKKVLVISQPNLYFFLHTENVNMSRTWNLTKHLDN